MPSKQFDLLSRQEQKLYFHLLNSTGKRDPRVIYTSERFNIHEVGDCDKLIYYRRVSPQPSKQNPAMFRGLLFHRNLDHIREVGRYYQSALFMKRRPKDVVLGYESKCEYIRYNEQRGYNTVLWRLVGHCDVEFKTGIEEWKFTMSKTHDIEDFPEKYCSQANTYGVTKKKRWWRLIMVSMFTLFPAILEDKPNIKQFKEVVKKFDRIHWCIVHGKPPACECDSNTYRYCNYAGICE